MSDEVKVLNVESKPEDLKTKVQNIIFRTLKSNIKGFVKVNIEEKTNDEENDAVLVNISSYGISYSYRLKLQGKSYEMCKESDDYAETLAYMFIDNYKEFITNKFFISEEQKKNRMLKSRRNSVSHNE